MMKIYTKQLINSIQTVVDTGKIQINTYKDYSFLTLLNSIDILLRFTINNTGNRDVTLIIQNSDINTEFIKEWKQTAPGKFLVKDFKQDKRDFIGNTLYHELILCINGERIKILIRLLNELTEDNITEEDKNNIIKQYGDLIIDGKYFSIIKIIQDNGKNTWGSWDKYKSRDSLIEIDSLSNLYNNTAYIENNDEIENPQETNDESEAEPLF